MKPRTKKQQMFVDMASQLPPLTDKQRNYPKEHIFSHTGYYWKGTGQVWCQYCGHIYKQDLNVLAVSLEVDEETCPHCGAHIKPKHWNESNRREKNEGVYMTIITTFKGYQVFRTFEAYRYNIKGQETVYTIFEVYQNWLDDKGNETIVSKSYTRSPFHFRWNVHSDWGIQKHNDRATGSYAMDDVFDVTDNYFYPRISVLPIFKRNGYDYCVYRYDGNSHEIAACMYKTFPEQLAWLETNIIGKEKRTIDATVNDPSIEVFQVNDLRTLYSGKVIVDLE